MAAAHSNWSGVASGGVAHPEHTGMPDRDAWGFFSGDSEGGGDSSRQSFRQLYCTAWMQTMCIYYGVSILLHYGVPVLMNPRRVQHGDIQAGADTKRDAVRALVPVAIRAGMLAVATWLHNQGYGVLSDDTLSGALRSPLGVARLVGVVVTLDLFHDTWFYFAHRLLHRPYLMKRVHYMHHQSRVPSAFSGYSFHWIEALLMFSNAIVEMFLLPMPAVLHRAYELWMIAIHVGGHCGFEMHPFIPHMGMLLYALTGAPKALRPRLNDVHHHDIHHRYPGYHFSLYFTHWDEWLGTLHPDWSSSVAEHMAYAPALDANGAGPSGKARPRTDKRKGT